MTRQKSRIVAALAAVLFFVATFIVGVLTTWLISSLTESAIVLNIIPLFVGSLVVTVILLRAPPRSYFAELGFGRGALRDSAIGLAIGCGVCVVAVLTSVAAGWTSWTPIVAADIRFDWRDVVPAGVLLLAVGAAAEELFVRGYFLQQLGRAITPAGSIAATSIVFALLHASNPGTTPIATVNTALYGAVFGLAILWHSSLWMSVAAHFAWNCTEALLGANISGLTIRLTELNLQSTAVDWLTGGEYGPEAGLVGTIGAVAMAAILRFVPRREGMPKLLWDAPNEIASIVGGSDAATVPESDEANS